MRAEPARAAVACAGSGLLVAASLPPLGWWPLAFVGLALFDGVIADQPAWSRFRRATMAAAAFFLPTLAWMVDLSVPGWVIAATLFAAMVGTMAAACPPRAPGRWLALPGGFVLVEAVRGRWPFGGVPLSSLAHGQVAGPLAPTVRLAGALLLVGLTVAVAVVVAAAVRRAAPPAQVAPAVVAPPVVAAAFAPPGHHAGELAVAVVQGGGPQGTRADDTDPRLVFERHLQASSGLGAGLDLVVWPEDVVDVDGPVTDTREGAELAALARELEATLVVGVVEDDDELDGFHNAAVAFGPGGEVVDRFEKVRRVPFGEFVPWRSLLEPLGGDDLADRDAIVGTGPSILDTPAGRLGVVISWEVFFADRGRDAIGNGGTVLLNPTNGASFRGIQVQAQQVASSRLRAIETGRWVLQAAPTGFSAIVSPAGTVVQRTGVSEQAVLTGTVSRREGETIATAVGAWPATLAGLAAMGGGWWLQRRRPASGERRAATGSGERRAATGIGDEDRGGAPGFSASGTGVGSEPECATSDEGMTGHADRGPTSRGRGPVPAGMAGALTRTTDTSRAVRPGRPVGPGGEDRVAATTDAGRAARGRRLRDAALVLVSLAIGIVVAAVIFGGGDEGATPSAALLPGGVAVDGRPADGGSAEGGAAEPVDAGPSPAAPAADPEAAVRGFLEAEVDRDFERSYGFVSAADRAEHPGAARWGSAHADFPPITGFEIEGVTPAGPSGSAATVEASMTFRSSLDEVAGLVPARGRASWVAVPEDGGWRVDYGASELTGLYPDDDEAPAAVGQWAADVQSCTEAEQYAGGLVGTSALADQLCGTAGALDVGAPRPLDERQATPFVSAFGPGAPGWTRLVPVRGAVALDVVVAPVEDRWLVVGVLAPPPDPP